MRLVPVERMPFNAETPMPALAEPVTPTALFYVRSHYDVPELDPPAWRLRVGGLVARPCVVDLKEIQARPARTVAVTMECAGNGRTLMTPTASGTPWRLGAVSTARFTGTPLGPVLDEAGVRPEAMEVLFEGADRGETVPGHVEPFMRSLPLHAARDPDVLLAWAMNDEPLPAHHGRPLRLVVPRWYGVASVKWLVGISLIAQPFAGYFQATKYVYEGEPGTPDGTPVTLTRVRSVIARPLGGDVLPLAPVEVAGTAWSGSGTITEVSVSADGGRTWTRAELGKALSPYGAVPWRHVWQPRDPGDYTLVARARDGAGHVQPDASIFNMHGYGNNVVHRVQISVRA